MQSVQTKHRWRSGKICCIRDALSQPEMDGCVVTGVGNDTEFGQIAQELSSIEKTTTPLQEKLDRLGKGDYRAGRFCGSHRIFAIAGHPVLLWRDTLNLNTVSDAFITSIVLIVAAVPEGLPTIVAVSLALNIIKMSRENALVKKMIACETIGCVNIICSDKTGTLTENKMTVQQIYTGQAELLRAGRNFKDETLLHNYLYQQQCKHFMKKTEPGRLSEIRQNVPCWWQHIKPVTEYQELRQTAEVVRVFPFSSQNKDMSTIVREENGSWYSIRKEIRRKSFPFATDISEEEQKHIGELMDRVPEPGRTSACLCS